MKTRILLILQLCAFLALTTAGFTKLEGGLQVDVPSEDQSREVLYLPNGQGLAALSLGYRNVLSNILWFNAISYFGKHFRSDQNYEWLYHMSDLVTTLDPNAFYSYDFASTMLSWEAHKPDQAIALLSKAIEQHPARWKFYYLRGFTFIYFLKEADNAQRDFAYAATLPGAPSFLTRLAAKVFLLQDNPEAAIDFLKTALSTTQDPNARAALERRLREAYMDFNIMHLSEAVEAFKKKFNRNPEDISELLASGIVSTLPPDPFGGRYYLDPDTGAINSTSRTKDSSL